MTIRGPLRVGVLGAGNIATLAHLPGLLRLRHATVVAICDRDLGRARSAASRFGIAEAFDDHERMFDAVSLDAVTVAVPPAEHAVLVLAAIARGLHVLCEKPLATTVSDAERMVVAAEDMGVVLAMNMHLRVMRESLAIKAAIDSGVIGRPRYLHIRYLRNDFFPPPGSWVREPRVSGGGALADMGSHLIDLAMWLTGSAAATGVDAHMHSTGRGANPEGVGQPGRARQGEDFASVRLRTDDGVSVTVECSWGFFGADESRIQVIGEAGGADAIVAGGRRGSFRTYTLSDDGHVAPLPAAASGGSSSSRSASLAVVTRGSSSRGPSGGHNPRSRLWYRSLASFVAAARGDEPSLATGRDGLVVQRILEAAYASARR